MKTILVPLDFSARAAHTARFGLELAHQINADLLLLHVVQTSPLPPSLSVPMVDLSAWNNSMYDQKTAEMREIEDQLNDLKRSEGFGDVVVRSRLVVGQPADSILEIARTEDTAFIVMSTVGESNAWEKIVGSVTYDVVKRAIQPLWILPNAVRLDELRQFTYFADMAGDEVNCIDQVLDLGKQLRAGMKVVHVSGADEGEFSPAEAMVDAFEVSYTGNPVKFKKLSYESIGEGIEAYTRENWPDAIVLANRNRGLIGKLFHKSMIRQLLLTSKRPILIIQKPDL